MLQKDDKHAATSIQSPVTGDRLMLFELSWQGHHAVYIRHLVRHWCERALAGYFYIVVAPEFIHKHTDIVAIAQQCPNDNLSIIALTNAEFASLSTRRKTFIDRQRRAWQEWALVCAYAKELQVDRCFLDSFDFFQWAFLFSQQPPCPISGIYFKPTFHYPTFYNHQTTFKGFLQRWREILSLAAIFRRHDLQQLMCLDPFAVEALNRSFAKGKAIALADPVLTYPHHRAPTGLKERLDIDSDRRIFLLFGELAPRKGLSQLLKAIDLLPNRVCQKLCLIVVGRCNAQRQAGFQQHIHHLRQKYPVQIIEHYAFVSEQEVQAYFQLADVVLAPYQKHVGMSGILLQAAAAQKPVLSSNYGLMGELVSRYQLGLAVDSTQPAEIARALQTMMQGSLDQFYSAAEMTAFCMRNTVEKFASTILASGAMEGQP